MGGFGFLNEEEEELVLAGEEFRSKRSRRLFISKCCHQARGFVGL